MNPEGKTKTIQSLLLILIIGFFIFHSYTLFPYTDDDAFITYRYARNFASGYGLVYNKGERVEGYTNFLWTLLISFIVKAGFEPVIPSKILGILFGIGTIIITFLFSNRMLQPEGRSFGLLAPLLLALSPSVTAWSGWGLETGLYSFLIVAGFYLFSKEFIHNSKYYPKSGFVFFLSALTRPEGLGMFGLCLLFIIIYDFVKFRRIKDAPRIIFFVLSFAIPYGLYFAWRLGYYGYPFPNTFYVRMGMTFSTLIPQFKRGLLYFVDFLIKGGGWGLILSLFLLKKKNKNILALFFYLSIISVIYISYVGGDSKQFFRLLVPFMPFYYLLIQEGVIELRNFLLITDKSYK